jgi:hypothetical protein
LRGFDYFARAKYFDGSYETKRQQFRFFGVPAERGLVPPRQPVQLCRALQRRGEGETLLRRSWTAKLKITAATWARSPKMASDGDDPKGLTGDHGDEVPF